MEKLWKRILSFVLVISLILTSSVVASAATEEEYLSELRLIYADTYNEAKEILSTTEFKDYKILNENLNEGANGTGVWLAYKTTTDIEDAITDVSVMQMCGGYNIGNYKEMIEESYEEYVDMGKTYREAIEYFAEAYDEGHFLAESAYRQLNFYNVVSEGVPKNEIPSFEDELLGDIFYNGISERELATMFFEGNSYALQNIRSLLAMGVSYNEDGKTYLDKVEEAATKMSADAGVYNNEDYDEFAAFVEPTIITLKDMLKELSAYESDLDYFDDEFTDDELNLAENKAVADMLRDVDYLDGKTLYEFCISYEQNNANLSNLYPLIAALNEGQLAMTKVAHYYDVIRYSVSFYPEELIISEIDKMEEIYAENPFNVYSGVDRTIYDGTFAMTSEAYRADAYGEGGLSDALFGGDRWKDTALHIAVGAVGIGVFVGAIVQRGKENAAAAPAIAAAEKATATLKAGVEAVASSNINAGGYAVTMKLASGTSITVKTYGELIDSILLNHHYISQGGALKWSAFEKYQLLMSHMKDIPEQTSEWSAIKMLNGRLENNGALATNYNAYQATVDASAASHYVSNLLFLAGGALLLYSACKMGLTVFHYYYPEFEDVPIAMVDVIDTGDGDRYIKYDVVYEAVVNDKGNYIAGDLNGYKAQRWNALYYTKSYEAGKPLLADEFIISTSNNKAKDGYAPVHRFGEEICYDLNKYNFSNKSPSIYLSVEQSKNDKSAVADVPQVVGSIFANGLWMLFGGVGALFGVGGTLGTQALLKKKREKKEA